MEIPNIPITPSWYELLLAGVLLSPSNPTPNSDITGLLALKRDHCAGCFPPGRDVIIPYLPGQPSPGNTITQIYVHWSVKKEAIKLILCLSLPFQQLLKRASDFLTRPFEEFLAGIHSDFDFLLVYTAFPTSSNSTGCQP